MVLVNCCGHGSARSPHRDTNVGGGVRYFGAMHAARVSVPICTARNHPQDTDTSTVTPHRPVHVRRAEVRIRLQHAATVAAGVVCVIDFINATGSCMLVWLSCSRAAQLTSSEHCDCGW